MQTKYKQTSQKERAEQTCQHRENVDINTQIINHRQCQQNTMPAILSDHTPLILIGHQFGRICTLLGLISLLYLM